MPDGTSNLFVFGLLKDPFVFRAVTGLIFFVSAPPGQPPPAGKGKSLRAVPAALNGFELRDPDPLYYHAVEVPAEKKGEGKDKSSSRIEGVLVLDVPADALAELARYEGAQSQLRSVTVIAESGPLPAQAFVSPADRRNWLPRPRPGGVGRRGDLKAEFAFRARLDRFLAAHLAKQPAPPPASPTAPAARPVSLRALREIHGATIEELVRAQFLTPGLSDFFLGQALFPSPGGEPSIARLRKNENFALFAENYVSLLVRQVIFNQFESNVFRQFRHELERLRGGDRFYPHAASSLAALRMLTASSVLLSTLAMDALNDLDYHRLDLADFVEWAINAAEHIYEPGFAGECVEWIAANRRGGLLPLGAELELSNLPHGAGAGEALSKSVANAFDPVYDAFRFFDDFGLDRLTWRLGGHVLERHSSAGGVRGGRAGFLAFTLGATGRRTELAAPISSDPWLVSQLIAHLLRFHEIQPHALALAMHLPRDFYRPSRGPRAFDSVGHALTLPESVVRCLLALAGDVGPDAQGQTRIRRITQREIAALVPTRRLDLLRIDRRPIRPREDETANDAPRPERLRPIAQYRFMRLAGQVDYEPIILALKGVQLHYRPADMLTHKQMQAEPELERLFDAIMAWAEAPQPISSAEATEFLDAVQAGLAIEWLGRSPHSKPYLDEMTAALERRLAEFNALLK